MKYRRLDENKDYVFGQNEQDFVDEKTAVEQAIYTRLKLLYGEWWENIEDGFPFFEQIAGQSGTEEKLQAMDLVVSDRILQTEGVLQIVEFERTFENREYLVYTKVNSIYGSFELEVNF